MGRYEAVIFDLDGVIVSTDEYHYQAWKALADRLGVCFDRVINGRLRGVSRMESLDIVLEKSDKAYGDDEKLALAAEKNDIYKKSLESLTPGDILPGVSRLLGELRALGLKIAIGSSSKNAGMILDKIGLAGRFDAVADGNGITRSKPDPEVFQLAAKLLGLPADKCIVVEDAEAGIDAAVAAGCKAVAVGSAAGYRKADYSVKDCENIDLEGFLR
jgi:beta-phosphoglucomutase